ncbi:PEGA domain-containing protein [candidate division KSB1 bacterium]|nr:PEGA domain-containing protein [candidate division KSB1 bacterium]
MKKRIYLTIANVLLLSVMNLSNDGLAQGKQNSGVMEGVQLFWKADFDKAIAELQNTITNNALSRDDIFSAYVYIGFSHARAGHSSELIENAFRKAVEINPTLKLDTGKIPPDLVKRFDGVRNEMIGSVYITSVPENATIIVYDSRNRVQYQGNTPQLVAPLLTGIYDIRLNKKGYLETPWTATVFPSTTDTIRVTLQQKHMPFYKKWWTWTAAGGIALASAYAILSEEDTASEQPGNTDLPVPPNRP